MAKKNTFDKAAYDQLFADLKSAGYSDADADRTAREQMEQKKKKDGKFDKPEMTKWLAEHKIEYLRDVITGNDLMMIDGELWAYSATIEQELIVDKIQAEYVEALDKRPSARSLTELLKFPKMTAKPYNAVLEKAKEWEKKTTDSLETVNGFLNDLDLPDEEQRQIVFTGLCQYVYGAIRTPMKPVKIKDKKLYPALDFIVSFYGDQGIGKSSIPKFLVSWLNDDYHRNMKVFKPGDRDNLYENTRGLIFEIAEMKHILKYASADDLKDFFSDAYVFIRKPYADQWEVWVKPCTYWGTTNDISVLVDDTGDRRNGMVVPGKNFGWWLLTPDPAKYKKYHDEGRTEELPVAYDTGRAEQIAYEIYWYLKKHPGAWKPNKHLLAYMEENNRKFRRTSTKTEIFESYLELREDGDMSKTPLCEKKLTLRQWWEQWREVQRYSDDKNLKSLTFADLKYAATQWRNGTERLRIPFTTSGHVMSYNVPKFSAAVRNENQTRHHMSGWETMWLDNRSTADRIVGTGGKENQLSDLVFDIQQIFRAETDNKTQEVIEEILTELTWRYSDGRKRSKRMVNAEPPKPFTPPPRPQEEEDSEEEEW